MDLVRLYFIIHFSKTAHLKKKTRLMRSNEPDLQNGNIRNIINFSIVTSWLSMMKSLVRLINFVKVFVNFFHHISSMCQRVVFCCGYETRNSIACRENMLFKLFTLKNLWFSLIPNLQITVHQLIPELTPTNIPPGVFLGKGVLKIWSKVIWEHPCGSVISIKL